MANPRFRVFNAYLPFTGGHPTHKLQYITGFQDVPESGPSERPEENVVRQYSELCAIEHPGVEYLWNDANKDDACTSPITIYFIDAN